MRVLQQETIAANTGRAYVVRKGQRVRVSGTTIADFVAFEHADLRRRFDQSRTRALHRKLFISTGDFLVSNADRRMLRIVEDSYTEGTHDLEKGMCSASAYRYQLEARAGRLERHDERAVRAVPDHGCWENLTVALAPWQIAPEDIPNPFNLFMTMQLDPKTGSLGMTRIRPSRTAHVDFEAEIDCLVGISACPDTMVGGKALDVLIYQA